MACECIKTECGTGKGKVKGYTVSTLCDECEAARVTSAIESAEQQKEQDVQILVAEKAQKMAKDELIKEGKLEIKSGKLKVKDVDLKVK